MPYTTFREPEPGQPVTLEEQPTSFDDLMQMLENIRKSTGYYGDPDINALRQQRAREKEASWGPEQPPTDLEYWARKAAGVLAPLSPTGGATIALQQATSPTDRPPSTASQIGEKGLDYLSMLAMFLPMLMGKGRGAETFGKETMDTLRRAQPQRWARMREENLGGRPSNLPDAADDLFESGRGSYREAVQERGRAVLPPGETPTWRPGESLPPGAVTRAPLTAGDKTIPDAYHLGTPIPLPGGREAQYVVFPIGDNFYIHLKDGERLYYVGATREVGEALAAAQKLQTRLTLAGSEIAARAEAGTLRSLPGRQLRLPWERSTAPRPFEGSAPSSERWAE